MPIPRHRRIAAIAIALSAAGCTQVKDGLNEASARIDSLIGVEGETSPADAEQAEHLYRQGLAARESGNHAAAATLFADAAELGHPAAAYELGLAYKEGRGVERDLDAGAQWINTAAARGDARAQYLIGLAYYNGDGVPQDHAAAVRHLADAATQNHAQAQYLLGEAFANGSGVAADPAWASRWYGKAAAQGVVEAQYAYGVIHAVGLGVPLDRVEADRWLRIAERGGHDKAAAVRGKLEAKMTAEEIGRARAAAERFRPRPSDRFADGPTVRYVQHALNGLGYDAGPVDGLVGPRTRAAIARFQKARGLARNDAVSPPLLEALLAARETADAPAGG